MDFNAYWTGSSVAVKFQPEGFNKEFQAQIERNINLVCMHIKDPNSHSNLQNIANAVYEEMVKFNGNRIYNLRAEND